MNKFSANKIHHIEMIQNYAVCLKTIEQSSILVIRSQLTGSL